MKPFITPEVTVDGRKILRFQCENVDANELRNRLQSRSVVACALPDGHSFQAAWLFRIILDNSVTLEFSAASTEVVDWQEVGSLNIRLLESPEKQVAMVEMPIEPFSIYDVEKIIYEDEDVISECGLVFRARSGNEIVIAAGVSPGSVSISAPFANDPFEPQFALSTCSRVKL